MPNLESGQTSASELQRLSYTALERINVTGPVDRLDYLEDCVKGKLVFDLGALDETAFQAKRENGNWLHARLCQSARQVVGIDSSPLVPDEGLPTLANGIIIKASIFELGPVIEEYGKPDVIIAGELIEHLPNTSELLQSLKANTALDSVEFIFSTPNACSWYNFLIGTASKESTHQDHLQIYSYKTLRTLFERSGFALTTLQPYHARFHEMIEESAGLKRQSVKCFQTLINTMERIAPILSGGWIGRARI